ncbi:MAG: hypothetical protein ACHQ49_07595 [Elusimicrobiota bacterium]
MIETTRRGSLRDRIGFDRRHWEELHPRPDCGPIYHCAQHSLNAASVMEQLAAVYFPGAESFLGRTAALHDVDPHRKPGTPARVPATLDWMRANRRGLKSRLRWGDLDFDVALAVIMRTEYPLDALTRTGSYRSVYARASPYELYKKMLLDLPPHRRAFALRAGAILSEYADKASWYMEEHGKALRTVQGLANEINAAGGGASVDSLGTHRFLTDIGSKDSFAVDDQLARELGLTGLRLPLIAEALSHLRVEQRENFRENILRFGERGRGGPAMRSAL